MRIFWFLLLALSSWVFFGEEARADVFRLHLLNQEMRYERDASQDQVDRSPKNFAISYQRESISALLEYTTFKHSSGNATYSFQREYEDLNLWLRYHPLTFSLSTISSIIQFYGGIGGGGYRQTVQTTFMGTTVTDNASPQFMSGLSLGIEFTVSLTQSFVFSLGAEGRALVSSDFEPNPMWSGVVRSGLGFVF